MTNTQPFFGSIYEGQRAIEATGSHFFSPETMRYWGSRILSHLYAGRIFVTSERGWDDTRRYTVRAFTYDESGQLTIGSVSEPGEYTNAADAKRAARAYSTTNR